MSQSDLRSKLKELSLEFIIKKSTSLDIIEPEVSGILGWLSKTPLHTLVPEESIQFLADQRILKHPMTQGLLDQATRILQGVLDHPENGTTPLSTLIPDVVVEEVAQYLSQQQAHRTKLLHEVFNNPAYVFMISQTVSMAISDYMKNNAVTKNIPGASTLMKFGKSAIEKATSSNLDDALQSYINKNIENLIGTTEKMANKYLDNVQVYNIIKKGWAKIRKQPVSTIREYVTDEVLGDGAKLTTQTWNHVRALDFIKTHFHDGIQKWYGENRDRTLMEMLNDLNITEESIREDLNNVIMPIVELLVSQGYLRTRISQLLDLFYEEEEVRVLLAKQASE